MCKLLLLVLLRYAVDTVTGKFLDQGENPFKHSECNAHCHVTGCSSYLLVNSALACNLTAFAQETVGGRDLVEGDQGMQCTKIIESTTKYIRCGKLSPGSVVKTVMEETKRLLVFETLGNLTSVNEINLDNYQLKPHPYLKLPLVKSVAYMSSMKMLLFATPGGQINSIPLDRNGNMTTLANKTYCFAMAVDENKQLVFLSIFKPKTLIAVLAINSRHIRPTVNLPVLGASISLHTKLEKLYICTFKKVLSASYYGSNFDVVTEGKIGFGLTFDPMENDLYYNTFLTIIKMSVSTGIKTIMARVTIHPEHMVFSKGMLYISSKTNVLKCHRTGCSTLLRMSTNAPIRLCLIP